ncbi:MAG: nucleotidyltransferase substrate binding protein [Pseudohongiellaceae bacterium]
MSKNEVPADKPTVELLEKTIGELEKALARPKEDQEDDQLRAGLIKYFEFTYEQSWKDLKRYLEYASPNPDEFDGMSFQDLIRTGNEQGLLLGDWSDWKGFRDMRNKTSHTYNLDTALKVAKGIPRFYEEAIYLRDQLRQRLK